MSVIKSFLNPKGIKSYQGFKVTAILPRGKFGLLVKLQRGKVCDQRATPSSSHPINNHFAGFLVGLQDKEVKRLAIS
jgi:hypothetical protein